MATNNDNSQDDELNRTEWDLRRMSVESTVSYMNPTGPRKVFLPIDGSPHSERAVEWFLSNLYKSGDLVILAFVVEPPQFPPGQGGGSSIVADGNKQYEEGMKEAKKLKHKFFTQFMRASIPEEYTEFKELIGTKPGETLIKYINEQSINCVVIGSRGLGKIKRTFLGSVSDYILHHANCPVIICPGRKEKKSKKEKEDKK